MAEPCPDNFICDYCERSFTRKYNLRIHIDNCHINTVTYCDICDLTFGSPSGLQQHLSRGHNRNHEGFPECDICGRIFKRKQNIVSHMITIHLQASEISCELCEKKFTTQRNLKRHMHQIHNPDFSYLECDDCSKIFKGKHSLIAHIQATHNISRHSSKCHICHKIYTNKRNLKRHIESFHGEKGVYKCSLCPKIYTSNQSLRRHSRIRHQPGKQKARGLFRSNYGQTSKVVCEKCGRSFPEEPLLRQHMKTDHSFQSFYDYCRKTLLKRELQKRNYTTEQSREICSFNCEFCKSAFATVYQLKDHMRISHNKDYCLSSCNVCFSKFYSKDTMSDHKKVCTPPPGVNTCNFCDKLFTDISSLEFHTRIFHPQSQIADTDITSTNQDDTIEDTNSIFKCVHCERVYYSDRSLKHHMKLKHTTDEAVECVQCGKICNNKYYLASHTKIVHTDNFWSKCDYCEKQFKSKRNIRRHIEYTHLGMQRYKCIECETLFKEKRSLRKHVRTKHSESKSFPQCHLCQKRFESAKSCKIHLKLVHSFNMNTHPCHLCSVSFNAFDALKIHLQTSHLAEDEIYKCEECNVVFKGQEKFEKHNEMYHVNLVPNVKQKMLPRCIICMKDFSTRKTLKRHIKKFHLEFDPDDLATFGSRKRVFNVDCEQCLKKFNEEHYQNLYLKHKDQKTAIIFTCEVCTTTYNALEFSVQKQRQQSFECKSKMILSELCTAEMSEDDEEDEVNNFGKFAEEMKMEPESTTSDLIKQGPLDHECVVKCESMSP